MKIYLRYVNIVVYCIMKALLPAKTNNSSKPFRHIFSQSIAIFAYTTSPLASYILC